jgi:hypothetical protein
VGFGLWIDGETAYAQGTHEYRPMGAAIIARSTVFTARDFKPGARPRVEDCAFAGFFASLSAMNHYLKSERKTKGRVVRLPVL